MADLSDAPKTSAISPADDDLIQVQDGFPLIPSPALTTPAGTPYLRVPGVSLLAKPDINIRGLAPFLDGFAPELHFPQYLDDPTALPPAAQLCKTAGQLCFDDQTEVLTDEGWKRFVDLNRTECVLTLNPNTRQVEFQKPYAYHAYDYNGVMKCVEGRDVSLCVTPEHRQYGFFYEQSLRAYDFVETQHIGSRKFALRGAGEGWNGVYPQRIPFPVAQREQKLSNQTQEDYGTRQGTLLAGTLTSREEIHALALLCVYYAAEGSLNKGEGQGIAIDGGHAEAVTQLCCILGLRYSVSTDPGNGVERIIIGGKSVRLFFEQSCGDGSLHKQLPRWVMNLPVDALTQVWDTLVKTEGYVLRRKNQQVSNQDIFLTASPTFAGQAQEILCKLGFHSSVSTSISTCKGTNYPILYVRKKLPRPIVLNCKGTVIQDIPYKGKVYCVTTNNSIVLVRRSGKPHFSGNCYMSFAPKRTHNEDAARYFRNILESGHGSVLEHAHFSFLFYGISRSVTHELVRHRVLSFSQVSQRYVSGRVLRFVERPEYHDDAPLHAAFEQRIDQAAQAYEQIAQSLLAQQKAGSELLSGEAKTDLRKKVQQAARSVLPNETEAPIIVTGNVRAWRHFIEMRANAHAETEIRALAYRAFLCLANVEPLLFADYRRVMLPDGTSAVESEFRKV